MIYISVEGTMNRTFPVFENKAGKLSITPSLSGTMDFVMTQNQFKGTKENNKDYYSSLIPGVKATFETGKVEVYASGTVEGSLKNGCFNSERESGNICVYSNRYTLSGGIQYNGKNLTVGADAQTIRSKTDRLDQIGVRASSGKTTCRGTYNVYTPIYGKSERYTYDSCSTSISVGKLEAQVGGTVRAPLNNGSSRGTAILADFGLKF